MYCLLLIPCAFPWGGGAALVEALQSALHCMRVQAPPLGSLLAVGPVGGIVFMGFWWECWVSVMPTFSNANFMAEEAVEKQGCSWCFSPDACHLRMSSVILQRGPTTRQVILLLMMVNLTLPVPFNTFHSMWSIFSYHFSWNMFFSFLFILFSLPHP